MHRHAIKHKFYLEKNEDGNYRKIYVGLGMVKRNTYARAKVAPLAIVLQS